MNERLNRVPRRPATEARDYDGSMLEPPSRWAWLGDIVIAVGLVGVIAVIARWVIS